MARITTIALLVLGLTIGISVSTFGSGAGSPAECNTGIEIKGDPTASHTAPPGQIVTGVCIKAGTLHTGLLGNGTFPGASVSNCYQVTGVETQTVTVTRIGTEGPGCQAIGHVDVKTGPAPPPSTFTLTVAGAGNGSGTVSATGISCTITAGTASGDCTETYNSGTTVTLTASPATGSVFAGWSGACSGSSLSTTVTMDANKSCTATFTLKTFTLTVTASPTGAQGGTFAFTVNSGSCSPGTGSYTTPKSFTCDNNSQVTISNPQSPVPTSPTDTRFIFSSFSPGASATITANTTITLNYTTQFLVSYVASGCVLSVTVPAAEWVSSGSAATGSFPTQVTNGGTRCNFISDNRPATITGPTTITGTYQTQFLVQYAATGCALSVSLPAAEWVNAGGNATGSFPTPVTSTDTRCQLLSQSPAGPITAPTTRTGTYKTQYRLMLSIDPGDVPGGLSNISGATGGDFFDSNTVVNLTANALVSISSDSRYRFSNWNGDCSGTSLTISVTMSVAKSCQVKYIQQFRVLFTQSGATGTVNVQFVGIHSVPFSDFFDAGSSLGSFQYDAIVGQFFCQSSCSGAIGLLTGPRVITAIYLLDNTPPTLTCTRITPANAFGWNNTDVQVRFIADDSGSGLALLDGTIALGGVAHFEFTKTITGEGPNLSVSATVRDRTGNVATASCNANIDKTPPIIVAIITPPPDPSGVVTTEGPVIVSFNCSDPPNAQNGTPASGIASCSPAAVLTTEGAQNVSGLARDRADNIAATTARFIIARQQKMIIQVKIKDGEIPPVGEEMTVEIILRSAPQGLQRYDLVLHVGDAAGASKIARIESIKSKTIDPRFFKVANKQDFFIRFKAEDNEDVIRPMATNIVIAEAKLRVLLPGRSLLWLESPPTTVVNDKGQAVSPKDILMIPQEFEVKQK